jgi:hypothetical protein
MTFVKKNWYLTLDIVGIEMCFVSLSFSLNEGFLCLYGVLCSTVTIKLYLHDRFCNYNKWTGPLRYEKLQNIGLNNMCTPSK